MLGSILLQNGNACSGATLDTGSFQTATVGRLMLFESLHKGRVIDSWKSKLLPGFIQRNMDHAKRAIMKYTGTGFNWKKHQYFVHQVCCKMSNLSTGNVLIKTRPNKVNMVTF